MMSTLKTHKLVKRPTQAVILAGGRGTRLRPITDTIPKPMIRFHGKPFLQYLIELLRDEGFARIVLLLGYLPDVIENHFGDGRALGVKIDYSVLGPDDGTARRVKYAERHLEDCFLLTYCDNYWPLHMDRMWPAFAAAGEPAMVTVYGNKDGYTRDSVQVSQDGYVLVYDRTCTKPNLKGVEISYALITKPVLSLLPDDSVTLFEEAVYPRLAAQGRLLAHVTHHRYYSVGDHHRLPLTERFLARQPSVILDRDGVLNRKPPRAEYVRRWEEFEWLPGAREALSLLKRAGYKVIVVSNQAGIARGAMSRAAVDAIHASAAAEAALAGGGIDAFYYCPHGWDEGCECRKPSPGLLYQAQRDFHLDLSRTVFVGDDERDGQAADAAGCPFELVSYEASLLDVTRRLVGRTSQGSDGMETIARTAGDA